VEPILFVITGPSGAGKGSVMRRVLSQVPNLTKVVTYTTRPPRVGETDGFDYHFCSVDRFQELVRTGVIYEYEQVYQDHYYGSPRDLFPGGTDALIELDYKGRRKYRARHPETVSIFLLPPSLEELTRRILARSEVPNLDNRLANAVEQLQHAGEYDYIVQNDDLDACTRKVAQIIEVERIRRAGRRAWERILEEVRHRGD
jgi:guanylate kinase